MDFFNQIIGMYPELTSDNFGKLETIELRDDGDGVQYIAKWEYSKPLPAGLKLGKTLLGGN